MYSHNNNFQLNLVYTSPKYKYKLTTPIVFISTTSYTSRIQHLFSSTEMGVWHQYLTSKGKSPTRQHHCIQTARKTFSLFNKTIPYMNVPSKTCNYLKSPSPSIINKTSLQHALYDTLCVQPISSYRRLEPFYFAMCTLKLHT